MTTSDLIGNHWTVSANLKAGDLILDHDVFGLLSRISPEAPIPVLHVKREEDRLGGAANVAANILTMGGRTTLVGAIGRDEPAWRFRKLAQNASGLSLADVIPADRPC
ncbi:MAG: hypothetical protein R3E76_00460 [Planctomycetota bacterium]